MAYTLLSFNIHTLHYTDVYNTKSHITEKGLFHKIQSEDSLTSLTGINKFALFEGICSAAEHHYNTHLNMQRRNTCRILPMHERVLMMLILITGLLFTATGMCSTLYFLFSFIEF